MSHIYPYSSGLLHWQWSIFIMISIFRLGCCPCHLQLQLGWQFYDYSSTSEVILKDIGKDDQGWGLLSQFPPFRYFPKFSSLSKDTLAVKYRVYIWQVSPQLSCGDTCQMWMWFEESNMYICEIENFAYGEINEGSFSNPHPCTKHIKTQQSMDSLEILGVYSRLALVRKDNIDKYHTHTIKPLIQDAPNPKS